MEIRSARAHMDNRYTLCLEISGNHKTNNSAQ